MCLFDLFVVYFSPTSTKTVDPIDLCSVLTDAMGNKELESVDENGFTSLHMAAMRGATICCIHLLQVRPNCCVLNCDR